MKSIIFLFLTLWNSLENKLIEEEYKYFCGTGLGYIILPPNKVVLSSTFLYDGDYKTKLRIKLGKSYSNEFNAKINYGQFKSKFN